MVEEARLKALRQGVSTLVGRREEVRRSLRDARAEVQRLSNDIDVLDQVAIFLRALVDAEITEGVKTVESLQSEGLKTVFHDQQIQVRADIEVSRGKVNVSLVTVQRQENGNLIEGESLDSFGGAISTVQSILLRLALIFRRGLRPVLFLDETLPAFDDRYVHNMAAFLKVLCKRLGVDILLVTHNPALVEAADRAYKIRRDRGFSTFHRLR